MTRSILVSGALAVMLIVSARPRPAEAIPVFAHRYGLTCQACHTEVPHLTPFGEAFLARGYRVPGDPPTKWAFPVAVRTELAYAGGDVADPRAPGNAPLPKAIVDEVELLTGGALGPRGSYWAEVYAVDGGVPGRPRDLWYAYRATRDGAPTPLTLRIGQFTLPLPLDPETFRETSLHYAIWEQSAGDNPFTFFAPKIGLQAAFGDPARAIAATFSVLQGHDPASGLPAHGADTMATLQRDLGDFTLSAYRYDGSRSLTGARPAGFPTVTYGDRFWRNGFAVGWERGSTRVDAAYQNGNDTAVDSRGDVIETSGGFVQARQALGPRAFAIARWDATRDAGFARSVTGGLGYRLSRNTRLTVFDTRQRDYRGNLVHVFSSSFLFAY